MNSVDPACCHPRSWWPKSLMIHGVRFWAMLLGNFWQCCCQRAIRWDTGPTTDLKYPDRNLLPILNGKVPKQHCSKKVARQNCSKSCPVYHQPNMTSPACIVIRIHSDFFCKKYFIYPSMAYLCPTWMLLDERWSICVQNLSSWGKVFTLTAVIVRQWATPFVCSSEQQ